MISRHPFNLRNLFRGPQPAGAFAVTSYAAEDTTPSTFAVEWTLNEPATGQLEYGATVAYGSTTAEETDLLYGHRQVISGVTAGQTVYYNIISVNAASVTANQAGSFTMPGTVPETTAGPRAAPATPTGPSVKIIGTHTVAVDDTGTTDVTTTLQGILNSLNSGDVLVFAQSDPEGYVHGTDEPISTYRISNILDLRFPDFVTLWGYGAKIEQTTTADLPTLRFYRSDMSHTTIAGFELYGRNYPYSRTPQIYTGLSGEKAHGIHIWVRTADAVIEDCWIHHMKGDGIYQAGWKETDWTLNGGARNITVRYNRIEDNKRQNLVNNVGIDWLISRNVFGNAGGGAIDCEDVKLTLAGQTLPKCSGVVEYNTFEQTTWHKSSVFGNMCFHINFAQGWNDVDGPPNYSQYGPWYFRNNTITGMGPSTVWDPAVDSAVWFNLSQKEPYSSTGYSGETRMQGLYIEDNVFDLPAPWQLSRIVALKAGYVDTLVVDGNTLQNLSVSVDTSGSAACSSISGSDT